MSKKKRKRNNAFKHVEVNADKMVGMAQFHCQECNVPILLKCGEEFFCTTCEITYRLIYKIEKKAMT